MQSKRVLKKRLNASEIKEIAELVSYFCKLDPDTPREILNDQIQYVEDRFYEITEEKNDNYELPGL